MKLKYQMRGLGIGIMVTALLMGVTTGKGIPLSDAEIKAKALELGMVESSSLKLTDIGGGSNESGEADQSDPERDAQGETGGASEEDGSEGSGEESMAGTDAPEGTDGEEASPEVSDGEENAGQTDSEPEESEEDALTGADDAVRIVIEFGMTSDHVSEILEDAGLVEDAAAFDAYLCANGLSRKITAGTYEFAPDVSEEEIIATITKVTNRQTTEDDQIVQ